MSELSNIKQFNCYTNQVFPGGALFLVATDYEFKRLFMELTNAVLGDDDCGKFSVATVVGKNIDRHNTTECILNPEVHISCEGQLIPSDNHKFLWLERPAVINSKSRATSKHLWIMVMVCCRCLMPSKHSCLRT